MIDLKQTKAICEAATAGPWSAEPVIGEGPTEVVLGCQVPEAGNPVLVASAFGGAELDDDKQTRRAEKDALFIAHARTALPELVGWVEKVQIVISEACRRFDNGEPCQMTHLLFHLESLLESVGGPTKARQRKIVQVAVLPGDENSGGVLYAVADDGSAWEMNRWRRDWEQLPPLPPVEGEKEGE